MTQPFEMHKYRLIVMNLQAIDLFLYGRGHKVLRNNIQIDWKQPSFIRALVVLERHYVGFEKVAKLDKCG